MARKNARTAPERNATADGDGGVDFAVEIRPLTGEHVSAAYPLAHLYAPGLGLEQWRAQVESANGQGGGLLAQSMNGSVVGLCLYRIVWTLKAGRTLITDDLIVAGMPGQRKLSELLVRGIEQTAAERDCGAIQINCETPARWLVGVVRGEGYKRCAWRFCKAAPA